MSQQMTIQVGGSQVEVTGSVADGLTAAKEKGGFLWLDLQRNHPGALADVFDVLGLPVERAQRFINGPHRTLIERHGEQAVIVVQPARYLDQTETVELSDLVLLVGRHHLITIHTDDWVDLDRVRGRIERRWMAHARTPQAAAVAICEAMLAACRPVLDGVENDIDEIEDQLFSDDSDVDRRIFALQRTVIRLQHAIRPLDDVFRRLHELDPTATSEEPINDLAASADHVEQRIEGFRRTLESALEIHSTMVNQANNDTMMKMTELGLTQSSQSKKISSWAAILFAPSIISGIYGMNFAHMPELQLPWAYPVALLAMVLLAGTLFVIFKRKDWL